MDASAIYQRTESGRSEIKNKMHGLTQSERLALIVTDGVSTYGDLRKKLNGLSGERFERALSKLLQKNLIFEILLPVEDAVAEELDNRTVDQFLHQDPLDPVTIMSIDPEDEFDLDMPAETLAPPQHQSPPVKENVVKSSAEINQIVRLEKTVTDKSTAGLTAKKPLKIASVDFYVPLENHGQNLPDTLVVPETKTPIIGLRDASASAFNVADSGLVFSRAPARRFAWAPVLMIGGFIIIVVSIALTFWR